MRGLKVLLKKKQRSNFLLSNVEKSNKKKLISEKGRGQDE